MQGLELRKAPDFSLATPDFYR